jgi:tetratricopeptide (TPR) repeat protein
VILAFALAAATLADPAGCPLATLTQPGWREQCEAAIKAESDPRVRSILLFRSAFAYNEDRKAQPARDALEEAVKLDPANYKAWHELGYTAVDMGDYAEGVAALDRAVAIGPDLADNFTERALARHYAGDLVGAWADRDHVVTLRPGDADALLARADAAIWLGKFDAASRDIDSAEAIDKKAGNSEHAAWIAKLRAQLATWSVAPGANPVGKCDAVFSDKPDPVGTVAACTAAFVAASDPARKAALLTARNVGWLLEKKDEDASIEDRRVAAGLNPGDAGLWVNLGFAYIQSRHSWAAERAFNRAIALKSTWVALAGRAAARSNLGNNQGALADANASLKLQANELALTVIGDVALASGDKAAARKAWLDAYRLGDRDDGLIERLKDLGVADPVAAAAGK